MADKPTQSAVVTPPAPQTPPAPEATQVEQRLERIEKKLGEIADNQQKTSPVILASSTETGHTSKPLLAFIFGLTGMKLGGALGIKIGGIVDMTRGYKRAGWKGVEDIFETLMTLGKNFKQAKDVLRYSIGGATIGTVTGTVGGIWIGWSRADRIKNPGDLIIHPIDSMKKIFGPDPKKPKHHSPTSDTSPAPTDLTTVSGTTHEGTITDITERQRA